MGRYGKPSAAQIKLEEPKWLSGGSHTSVFNGGLLGSHFGSPEIQKHVYMYLDLRGIHTCIINMVADGAVLAPQIVPQKEPKWVQLVRKGVICLNGSPGSPKSSFSFMCVGRGDVFPQFVQPHLRLIKRQSISRIKQQ